ncbi:phosphomannomutase 2-like [Brachionus plicatilis]|uniref:Phosphomannomutase n=1 Tax=Brachionus plicatilis TaxID=10195 RepID=A0A3M7SET7_BRAPC|nr:phosphomannomutase 2-like [Brachionus plicatilis]
MEEFMERLKQTVTVGLVGGSDLGKILEQLGGQNALKKFDYVFSENGLVSHKNGELIFQENICRFVGEEKLQKFINFCLKYLSELWLPFKRGTFIETRSGLLNIAPPGRSCTQAERDQFEKYDQEHKIREKFIQKLKENFPEYNLVYSIGGQISFDVFPEGWDKRFCLTQVQADGFEKIYFFGDKTFKGGNDYEIANDPRTVSFTVTSPENTIQIASELLTIS